MKRRTLFVALFVATGSLAACGEPGVPSEVRLRLEYEEGDTLLYEYHTEGVMTAPDTSDASGRSTHPYERNMTVEEAVRDVTPSGNYVLAWTFHLPADTAAVDAPVRLTVEITPQGRILSIGGVETARPLFGEIDFQSYFEQSQAVFPDRPLKVGDSWTQEVKVLSPRSEPVVTTSTYVLERIVEERGEPFAVIAFDGDIYLPTPYPSGADSTAGTTMAEERIRVQGEMFFALDDGRVERAQTEVTATLTKIETAQGGPVRREIQFRESNRYELVNP